MGTFIIVDKIRGQYGINTSSYLYHFITGDGKTCFIKRLIGEGFDEKHNKTNALEADLKCKVKITHHNQAWERSNRKHTELIREDLVQGLQQALNDDSMKTSGKAKVSEAREDAPKRDVKQKSNSRKRTNVSQKETEIHPGPQAKKQLTDDDQTTLKLLNQWQKAATKKARKAKKAEPECIIHVWDFGGDLEFYNLHQIFLRPKCVYSLIINLSRNLHAEIPAHQMPYHGTSVKMKYYQQIEFWLNMIASHATKEKPENGKGNVVLVGTHKDLLPGDPKEQELAALKYYEELCDLFINKEHANLVCDFVAVDSKGGDPENYAKVRKLLLQGIKEHCRWNEKRPIRWLRLERRLHELRYENDAPKIEGNIIEYDKVKELGKDYNIDTEVDLLTFLEFHHLTADITFCKSGDLGKYVVADPQWLIDVFRALITLDEFLPQGMKYRKHKENLKKKGIVDKSSDLLEKIWEKFFQSCTVERQKELKEYLLSLMSEFDLAVKYTEDKYMIPCMLPVAPSRNRKQPSPGCSLYYKFHATQNSHDDYQAGGTTDDNFLPQGLFQKLVSRCSKLSQVESGWQWDGPKQFQNAVTFKDGDNLIYLETENTWIRLNVVLDSNRKVENKDYQSKVSSEIDFLLKTYHRNMWYEFAVNPCERDATCTCKEAMEGQQDSPKAEPTCTIHGTRESCVVGTGLCMVNDEQKGEAARASCQAHEKTLQTDAFLHWFGEYTLYHCISKLGDKNNNT